MSVALIKEINDQVNTAVSLEISNFERRLNSAQSEITSLLRQEDTYRQTRNTSLSQKSEADTWLTKNRTKKIVGYCLWGVCIISFMSGGAGGVILGILCGIYGVIFGLRDIIYSDIRADKYSAENKIRDAESRISQANRNIEEVKINIRERESVIAECRNELNRGRDYFWHKLIVQTLDENQGERLHEIEKNAKQALTTYQVDDAIFSYHFLDSVFPDNGQYKSMEKIGVIIKEIVSRTSPKVPSLVHGKERDSIDSYTKLLWDAVLSDSLQYFELNVIMAPLIQLSDNGFIAIDFLAGLIYIDSKYGRKAVEKICHDYSRYLGSFLDKSTVEKLNNMSSFSVWCGNLRLEKQFSEASTKKQNELSRERKNAE